MGHLQIVVQRPLFGDGTQKKGRKQKK